MALFLSFLLITCTSFSQELTPLNKSFIKASDFSSPVFSFSSDYGPISPINAANIIPSQLGRNPLIVVHATSFFDEDMSAKRALDELIFSYRKKGSKIIYLLHDESTEGMSLFYTAERRPDYEFFSAGGEHNLPLDDNQVTVAGGFFGSYDGSRGCHALAVRDAIRMHFESSMTTFTVNMPMEAIYYYAEDSGMIKQIMALDPRRDTPEKIKEVFGDFAGLFFLVDNFETSTPDSLGFAHPFLSLKEHPGYRPGEPVDTARYSFRLYFEDILVQEFGQGPRKVNLKLRRKI